jgi:hypothetical protein
MTIGWCGAVGVSSLRGFSAVGGGGDEDVASAGDGELDDDETDETRWMTEQRTTARSDVGGCSSDLFCVERLMSWGSGRMLIGSLTMMPSSLVFGDSHELVMTGGVGGYSFRWACVKMNLCEPLPYGISPPKSDDLKRRGGSAASIWLQYADSPPRRDEEDSPNMSAAAVTTRERRNIQISIALH